MFPTSEVNDIISVLDGGRVDIEVSGPHINIKSESGVSFDISTVPFQEYPEIPENKHDNLFCIETSSLKDIISSLMYAVNSEPTKPSLNGACFNFLESTVDFVATDGHRLVKISKNNGVSIGAHPSFKDPDNFGRERMNLRNDEIKKLIFDQYEILQKIAILHGENVTHIKPHGALNNMACEDFELASTLSLIHI